MAGLPKLDGWVFVNVIAYWEVNVPLHGASSTNVTLLCVVSLDDSTLAVMVSKTQLVAKLPAYTFTRPEDSITNLSLLHLIGSFAVTGLPSVLAKSPDSTLIVFDSPALP